MSRTLLVAACACLALPLAAAERERGREAGGERDKTVATVREHIPAGTKGTITGTITAKEKGRVTIRGEEKTLTVMPRWKGGMPQDGGGFDQEMLRRLEDFKVGDRVTVAWTFEEHHRIDTIAKAQ